jgi:hypothetical protein
VEEVARDGVAAIVVAQRRAAQPQRTLAAIRAALTLERSGEFVTMDELIGEVGVDAARWFLLARSHDTTVDFALDLARQETAENPVFYVQYAHARIASLLAKAGGDARCRRRWARPTTALRSRAPSASWSRSCWPSARRSPRPRSAGPPTWVSELRTYADGEELDLPGRPRVIPTPGHTAGHASILLAQEVASSSSGGRASACRETTGSPSERAPGQSS